MRRLLLSGLALGLVGALIGGGARIWKTQTEQHKQDVARMTGKMQTVCVGRFLVDFPTATKYEFRGTRVFGFDISVFPESDAEFEQRVRTRQAELEALTDKSSGRTSLELHRPVKSAHGFAGHVFVHSRDVNEGQSSDGLTTARYRHESVAVEALVRSHGISIDISAPIYDPESTSNVMKLIEQLVPNPQNLVLAEPGFCIDRAYIREPLGAEHAEQLVIDAWQPDRPDIVFQMSVAAGTEPDRHGLLRRAAESYAGLTVDERRRVIKMRANERTINGINGEEVVERFLENNGAVVHSFWWEVNGTNDDVFLPHIVFRMDTGHSSTGPVPSSLTDAVALGLWDEISSSIRLKRTDSASNARTKPPRTDTRT